jgi:hypothetical protein
VKERKNKESLDMELVSYDIRHISRAFGLVALRGLSVKARENAIEIQRGRLGFSNTPSNFKVRMNEYQISLSCLFPI